MPNSPFTGLLSEKGQAVEAYKAATANQTAANAGELPVMGGTALGAAAPVLVVPTPNQKPTLWLIGDSTVQVGTRGQMGWGTQLPQFFDVSKIGIQNRVKGGRSSRTFCAKVCGKRC